MRFCWIVLLLSIGVARPGTAADLYSLVDLGRLPGNTDFSEALDINASGWIVGTSITGLTPATARRGFLWKGGGLIDVGDLPGGSDESFAVALNASGQVVGYSGAAAGRRPFLWEEGSGLVDLSTLPGNELFREALDINDAGSVVGSGAGSGGNRAYLWESGLPLLDLGVFPTPGTFSNATAINAQGDVVGWGAVGPAGIRALLWPMGGEPGEPDELGELAGGDDRSIAFDIDDAGLRIVGRSNAASGNRAVVWIGGAPPVDLGDLPGGTDGSEALGVNNLGEIVGIGNSAAGARGVLWDETGGPYDLNDRLDASGLGYEIIRADAINDAGQIAATARLGAGTRAVRLTPVPEPAAAGRGIAALAALVTLSRARLRRIRSSD